MTTIIEDVATDHNANNCDEYTLADGIHVARKVLKLFFQNKFAESDRLAQKDKDRTFYNSIAVAYPAFAYGIFTMEKVSVN